MDTGHQHVLSTQPLVSAMTRDTLNTLGEVTIPKADKRVIALLLQQQRQRRGRTGFPKDVNANETISSRNKPTTEKISRGSIATFSNGVWINDGIINFVGRVLIAPGQNTSQPKTHIYSIFFMSRLLVEGAGRKGYNFKAVRNDDSRIEGGPGSLDELYIQINVNNVHWSFIRGAMTNKMILLFDSQDTNTENKKHLQATEHYMYEALEKDQGTGRHNFADWKEAWSSTDKLENSPKQGNRYDCGIFTLISTGLLWNGHRLRSNSFFQTRYIKGTRARN